MSSSSGPSAAVAAGVSSAAVAARTRASGTFVVITVIRGNSSSTIAARAGSSSSTAPDSATITGSRTTGVSGSSSSSARRTARTVSAVPSMPIFTASTPMSSATALTWATMKSPGTGWMPVTATVFWAVSATMAVMPWTPQRANAFRSAWMPAPPPESDPAIDSTAGTGRSLTRVRVENGGLATAEHDHATLVRVVADELHHRVGDLPHGHLLRGPRALGRGQAGELGLAPLGGDPVGHHAVHAYAHALPEVGERGREADEARLRGPVLGRRVGV